MDEFKIGEIIEVSDCGSRWHKRKFLGMFSKWFMATNGDLPIAWEHARPIPIQPTYRTPTIEDWGKVCEFWDFNIEESVTLILCGVIPNLDYPFLAHNTRRFRNARIKV